MISWSRRKQLKYILFISLIFIGILLVFLAINLYTPATCFDGEQNQNESGIDCGGPCNLICNKDTINPTILWSRVFQIKNGVFSAFAYIQNPNNAESFNVPYELKLYDSQNILVYSSQGHFFLPANKSIGVLSAGLRLGSRRPVRADFEINNSKIVWQKPTIDQQISVYARDTKFSSELSGFKVNSEFVNRGKEVVSNLNIVVILYDTAGNALGASKSKIDIIPSGAVKNVIFTWPNNSIQPKRAEYLYWIEEIGV